MPAPCAVGPLPDSPPASPRAREALCAGWLLLALLGCDRADEVRAPDGSQAAPGLSQPELVLGVAAPGRVIPPRRIAAVPHRPEARPVLNGAPAHLLYDVPLPGAGQDGALEVAAFPVGEYRRHYVGGARAGFDRRFGALRAIIQAGELAEDGEIPLFPQPDADQRFRARIRWLELPGARGVAFVTHLARDASPPGEDELVWVAQLLTDDDAWLLSARQPLRVRGVPASEDPRRVAAVVDTLPAEAFTPDLDRLLAALGGLRLVTNPEREP